MKNVKRDAIPNSLSNNAVTWTNELLAEISRVGSFADANDSYKNKYRQDDIKEALANMYDDHCCYCESIIGKDYATYGRIEHLKPKSIFHNHCYDWKNLHWSCEVCNTTYKKDNWDYVNPILDPCVDKISDFLYLDINTGKYKEKNSNARATTTIEHTGLNRDGLVKARRLKLIELSLNYKQYKKNGTEASFISLYTRIKDMLDYPSVFEEFLKEIT